MIDLWRLLRVHNLVIAAVGVVAGGWIALGSLALPKLLVFASLSAIGLGATGNVANDLWDAAGDRVNRPGAARPIAAGRLSRETGHLLAWLGILLGLAAAALVSGRQVLVGGAALFVMLAYSPWIKRSGPPATANVAVALVAGVPLFYGALAVGRASAGVVPWILAGWLHLAREITKDVEDEAGDRVLGRQTLPIRWGRAATLRVAWWISLAFVPLSVVLPFAVGYRVAYFMAALPAQVLIVLAALRLRRNGLEAVSGLLKAAMVIGLGALVLGKVT